MYNGCIGTNVISNLIRPNVVQAAGYVPGEQPVDSVTIKLNTNENPYPPSPRVLQAIAAITPEQLRRYPSPSGELFRKAAAKIHGIDADWIMTFNGGDELLSVIIRSCSSEKDTVLFMEPSYSLYPVLIEMHGAQKLVGKYEISGTNWSLPANIENSAASLFLLCNPNAPSGHCETIARLESIAEKFRGLLVIDEAYVDFAAESAISLVQKYSNVLILRSMSKGYSLAGLRFGYAIGQPKLLKEIEKVRDSYPCDAISIAAATAAIEDQIYAKSTWEKVKLERVRLSNELRSLGFTVSDSQSNFILAQVPEISGQVILSGKEICQALKEREILVRWWNLAGLTNKIRITVGTPEQNDQLLNELSKLFESRSKLIKVQI